MWMRVAELPRGLKYTVVALFAIDDAATIPESRNMTTNPHSTPASAYVAVSGGAWRSTALTRGPWDPMHQHAGPPVALACRAFECAAREHGLGHIARLTANLFRPVPIGELALDVSADYVGRNTGHLSARLMSGDKEVARFTALARDLAPRVRARRPWAARNPRSGACDPVAGARASIPCA